MTKFTERILRVFKKVGESKDAKEAVMSICFSLGGLLSFYWVGFGGLFCFVFGILMGAVRVFVSRRTQK